MTFIKLNNNYVRIENIESFSCVKYIKQYTESSLEEKVFVYYYDVTMKDYEYTIQPEFDTREKAEESLKKLKDCFEIIE